MLLNWTYHSPGAVASSFAKSKAFIKGLRGPIGSGKSTVAVMTLLANARNQRVLKDGWRRRRTAIVRNTYVDLKLTTIPTVHQWIPDTLGHWVNSGPPRQHIIDYDNKFEWEIIFLALDKPKDVRKVLSLDLSDAWCNEARELPKAIIDGLTGRIGRYPKWADGGASDIQLLLDTNSMDSDHWWYVLAEHDTSTERNRALIESMLEAERELRAAQLLASDQPLFEFYSQPDGESALAENLQNVRPGYYQFAKAGKSVEWVNVYVRNRYGFVSDGKAVFAEYVDSVHCKPIEPRSELELHIGLDFGLTPAAAFMQRTANGRVFFVDELVSERMGVLRFGEELKRKLEGEYAGFRIGSITGDPAGDAGMPDDEEKTVFTVLEKQCGIKASPAHSNDFTVRREAFAKPMTRMVDGQPGFIVSPKCVTMRKGLGGAYCFKRVAMVGEERFRDMPDKNKWSHVCEAGQYAELGAGEGKALLRPGRRNESKPKFAQS